MNFELTQKEYLNSRSPVPKGLRKIIDNLKPNKKQIEDLINYLQSDQKFKSNIKFYEQSLNLVEKYELNQSDFKHLQYKVADFQMRKLLSKTLNVKIIMELISIEFIDFGTLSYLFNESQLIQDQEYNKLIEQINSSNFQNESNSCDQKEIKIPSEIQIQNKTAPFQLKMALLYETYQDNLIPELMNDDAINFYDNINLSELNLNINFEDQQLDMFKPTDPQYFDLNTVMHRKDVQFIDASNKDVFIKFIDEQIESELVVGVDCEWLIDPLQCNKKSYLSTIQLGFMLQSSYELLTTYVIDAYLLEDAEICEQLTRKILQSDSMVIVGYDFEGDIKNQNQTLRKCQKENARFATDQSDIRNMQDLQLQQENKMKSSIGGLKKLTKSVLGVELDKFEQISCWENRPLRESQLHYAALDSVILLLIYKKIKNDENSDVNIISKIDDIYLYE